jgi:hypothetical protein
MPAAAETTLRGLGRRAACRSLQARHPTGDAHLVQWSHRLAADRK